MLDAINPFAVTSLARPAMAGLQQLAQGFASVLGVESPETPPEPSLTAEELSNRIAKRFEEILQNLGIDPNQPLSIEVDAQGTAWVTEGDPSFRGDLEMALNSSQEMSVDLADWAIRYGPPGGAATLQWPMLKSSAADKAPGTSPADRLTILG